MADYNKNDTREFGKINFDFLLMTHIQNINQQLAKLPHELVMPDLSRPVGTTYKDILLSYYNMVEHLEALLKPYHDEDYKKLSFSDNIDFPTAKKKFGSLMELCDRKGFLFTKMKVKTSGEADDL